MRTALAIAIATLALAAPAAADEMLIPGVNDGPAAPVEHAAPNPMAACFLDASSPQCRMGSLSGGTVAFESMVPGGATLEVLSFTAGSPTVTVTHEPPPSVDYTAAAAAPAAAVPVKLPAVTVTIQFDFDSDRIRADQAGTLAQLAGILKDPALTGTRYAVIGHTDAKGSAAYNCDLSRRRAFAIVGTLQANLVPVVLVPLGFGEGALGNAADPDSPENRRVTFLRLPNDATPVLSAARAICGA